MGSNYIEVILFDQHFTADDESPFQVLGDRGFPGLRKLRALDLSNSPRLNIVSAQAFQVLFCLTRKLL